MHRSLQTATKDNNTYRTCVLLCQPRPALCSWVNALVTFSQLRPDFFLILLGIKRKCVQAGFYISDD